jgi:5-methyltetrahydrofolate--homocysteine methyltransferase
MEQLIVPARRIELVDHMREEALATLARPAEEPVAISNRSAREWLGQANIPNAPFFGPRTIRDLDVSELWSHFDLRSLFRLSWGGSSVKGAQWEALVRDEFEPRLRRFRSLAERSALLEPKVVYGYFPAAGDGDDVVIYDPADIRVEIARLRFTRQSGGQHLCLADYLRKPGPGHEVDVIALQVVTVGAAVSERIDAMQQSGDYSESYFLHGFSVQAAEALAEHTHRRIRSELGIADDQGKRYSWGYGACPDLTQHETVWRLLDTERAIGTALTTAHQIVPEQSTAAIIIHHPQATYFNAAASRELLTA